MSNHATKYLVRVAVLLPFAYLIWLATQGGLGAQPAKKLNQELGAWGVRLLLANLYIGALVSFWRPLPGVLRPLAQERRWMGVTCFVYLVFHVVMYVVETADIAQAIEQVYTKRYLIFGGLALVILSALAATSNDYSVRKLGRRWKSLHRLVHVAVLFVAVHVFSIEKGDLGEALLYFVPLGLVQGWRGVRAIRARR